METRRILIYWILMLVPTLVIGGVALQLLRHEQGRLDRAATDAALQQAVAMADTIVLTLTEVKTGFIHSLERVPESEAASILSAWERENPLIRHGFQWDPAEGLQYPQLSQGATGAEAQFARRYDALFSGRRPWPQEPVSDAAVADSPAAAPAPSSETPFSSRRSLARLAREPAAVADAVAEEDPEFQSGWIPWFFEDRLHLLGWVRRTPAGPVFGIELELMTVLARLLPMLPDTTGTGTLLALMDGQGQVVHQTAGPPVSAADRPTVTASLAPDLPHWHVAVFFSDGSPQAAGRRGFFVVAALLLAIFMAALLLGGGLITWQAVRHLKDARRKTSFVANVSHELKTPLTSIRMYAELLAEGRVAGPEKQRRYLDVIVEESRRLTRLVNNVLAFGRLEQGRKTYRIESIDLVQWLPEMLDPHRMRLVDAGIALERRLPASSALVSVDRDALEQVVLNLVDNAIKYAAEGGLLRIELSRSEDRWLLAVEDRGAGIAPEFREKVFDQFTRMDDSLTTRQPGSGLGLSIARRLTRDMGGDLDVVPADPCGARFRVYLPRQVDLKKE